MKKLLLAALLLLLAPVAGATESTYDPLATDPAFVAEMLDLTVQDVDRAREIPIRVYLPSQKDPAPVILFSHGLGGSRENSPYLGGIWAARGYVAVFLQHPGSDEAVWKNQPQKERVGAMRDAASIDNFLDRVKDVAAVLDQLERWQKLGEPALRGRLDLSKIGMTGHSFGAITTQAVAGQSFRMAGNRFTDERIDAAIAMSPSAPRRGNTRDAFAKVEIPWLLMTGTKDDSPIGEIDVASRLSVFPALPPGDKYELVLWNAEHSAFSDRPLPLDREGRNPNHHRVICALSVAFWDTYLRGDEDAKAWLKGSGALSVLEKNDRWQRK